MRHFILVAIVASGGFALVGPRSAEHIPTTIDELEPLFDDSLDVDLEQGVVAIEVAENTAYVLPEPGHGDEVLFAELAAHSAATHLDVAGVQRTAAGRPIDAAPGSMDAALTGMQHDAAGTVRNTVSPSPTPSPTVQAALAEDPNLREQPAPSADEASEHSDEAPVPEDLTGDDGQG
jgi:hypothetical protein